MKDEWTVLNELAGRFTRKKQYVNTLGAGRTPVANPTPPLWVFTGPERVLGYSPTAHQVHPLGKARARSKASLVMVSQIVQDVFNE